MRSSCLYSVKAVLPLISDYGSIVCEHPPEVKLEETIGGFKVWRTYRYGKVLITVYRKYFILFKNILNFFSLFCGFLTFTVLEINQRKGVTMGEHIIDELAIFFFVFKFFNIITFHLHHL